MNRRIPIIFTLLLHLLLAGLSFADDQKFEITSVTFSGNRAFDADRLHNVMLSRPSSLFHTTYYHQDRLQKDLENLELFYQQQGYLEAKITGHEVEKDSSDHEVKIHISLQEGPLTRVDGISIFGNKFFSDKKLRSDIKIEEGEALVRKKIEDSNVAILTRYANNGFLDAEVQPDVRVDSVDNRALVDFIIRENIQYHVGEIRYNGLEKTDTNVVRRELEFRHGDVLNYSKLLKSQRDLYLTGLFQSVYIRPRNSQSKDSSRAVSVRPGNPQGGDSSRAVPVHSGSSQDGDSSMKVILVDVKESKSIEFNVSVGYGTIDKVRGRMEVYDNNLAGTGRKLGLLTRASFIERHAEASFTEPWTFGTEWRTDLNAFIGYQEEPGYHLNRVGGKVVLGRDFLKRSKTTIAYRREQAKLSSIKTEDVPDNLNNDVRSLQLSLIYDTRNNLFNSTKGQYAEWTNESFGAFLQGDITFFRSSLLLKFFVPLRPKTILASAIDLGWISAKGGLQAVPLNERFYTGGPNTIRGFEYQKVGPLDANGVPTGGRIRFVWNALEIRQTIYKMIGGVIFVDLGNVWANPEDVRLNDVRQAIGPGIRVNTPIGLVRVDYGFNINPRPGEPRGQLSFGMGQAF